MRVGLRRWHKNGTVSPKNWQLFAGQIQYAMLFSISGLSLFAGTVFGQTGSKGALPDCLTHGSAIVQQIEIIPVVLSVFSWKHLTVSEFVVNDSLKICCILQAGQTIPLESGQHLHSACGHGEGVWLRSSAPLFIFGWPWTTCPKILT